MNVGTGTRGDEEREEGTGKDRLEEQEGEGKGALPNFSGDPVGEYAYRCNTGLLSDMLYCADERSARFGRVRVPKGKRWIGTNWNLDKLCVNVCLYTSKW